MDDDTEGDSLLREVAAAPSVDVPVELATIVLLEPETIVDGKFKIEERLGAGGMGIVYAARDLALGREVAIKLMRLERSVGRFGDRLPEVFDREARATARLNHPNVVTLHQFGNWNGILYLVLERLHGETLAAHLERGPVPLLTALAIMEQVANALVHTHAAGVIHRDLKPQNVFLLVDGGVKVLDFGVSGLALATAPTPPTSTGEDTSPRMTLSHAGTPGYMAPEQWLGEPQDGRTDLWAIGVMLYQLVTGTLPFGLAAPQRVEVAPFKARLPVEAAELVPLVEKCLAIRRDDRQGDAAEVASTLHRIRTRLDPTLARSAQPRSRASRIARAAFALAGVAAIAGGAAVVWSRDTPGSACGGAENQLTGIWDAPTRARLGSLFAAAGPNGAATWTAVAMTLDRYAREWVAMKEQACRVGDATMSTVNKCLDERREQLARFAREHEDVRSDQIVWTLAAAQALPPVADCADSGYLARWAPTTAGSMRSPTGLVRSAVTVNGPGVDVFHSALPIGDDFIVSGVVTNGATFGDKRIDETAYFLARVSPTDGKVAWIVTSPHARVIEIARGSAGDILVAGWHGKAGKLAGKPLAAPRGAGDCFASSLDATTGAARWLVPCDASSDAEIRAVSSDGDGNVYAAGDFSGRARFGGPHDIDAQARPTMVPFVASWSPSGALRWVTAGRGTGAARTKGIAVDGDAVVVGTRIVGAGWLGDRELKSGGCVVARLDRATGAIRWLRELEIVKCELDDVAVQGDRVAAVGRYRGRGAWIEELDLDDGSDRWRTRLGTHDQEGIRSAVYTEHGVLTVTGYFGGPALEIGAHTLHGNGGSDIFIASFDRARNVLGALAFGGAGADLPRWIGQGTNGTLLFAGRFSSSVIVGTRELRASGDADAMLLELQLPWLESK
jgi:hypothetical protein